MTKNSAYKSGVFTIYKTIKLIETTIYEKCSDKISKNVLTNMVLRDILQLQT